MHDTHELLPADPAEASRQDFEFERQHREAPTFTVDRGLRRDDERGTEEGYVDTLPTFEGKNIAEVIEGMVWPRCFLAACKFIESRHCRIIGDGFAC